MTFEGRPRVQIKECNAKSAPYPTPLLFFPLISPCAVRTPFAQSERRERDISGPMMFNRDV